MRDLKKMPQPGTRFVGEFEVRSGKIGIWDPCYGDGDRMDAVNGTWVSYMDVADFPMWGRRVWRLRAACKNAKFYTSRTWAGECGVDSGQMGIYDCRDELDTSEVDYDRICDMTCGNGMAGVMDYGVVSSSGFGDGTYEYTTICDKEGLVCEIEITFVPEEKCMNCGEVLDYGTTKCQKCGTENE